MIVSYFPICVIQSCVYWVKISFGSKIVSVKSLFLHDFRPFVLSARYPFGQMSFGHMSIRSFIFRSYVLSVICLSAIRPFSHLSFGHLSYHPLSSASRTSPAAVVHQLVLCFIFLLVHKLSMLYLYYGKNCKLEIIFYIFPFLYTPKIKSMRLYMI